MASHPPASASTPAHLSPSALGSKTYWDHAYTRELTNHRDNSEDEGTIWFEDSGAEEKMIAFLEGLNPYDTCQSTDNADNRGLRVLDLGTGNGHLLFALRDEGWKAEMVGVDYSETSVELATQIQRRRHQQSIEEAEDGEEASQEPSLKIDFEVWDMLKDNPLPILEGGFHFVLDKGTFDAISLNDQPIYGDQQRGCEVYGQRLSRLIKPHGFFLITSCNWTTEELRHWFERPETHLQYHGSIPYRSFTFGGVNGQSVSSVCFRRKAELTD